MTAWVREGFDAEQFFRLTPREVQICFNATAQRLRREHNERMELAWTGAAFERMKKMPKLETVLTKDKAPAKKRQTWEEQFALMSRWALEHNKRIAKSKNG